MDLIKFYFSITGTVSSTFPVFAESFIAYMTDKLFKPSLPEQIAFSEPLTTPMKFLSWDLIGLFISSGIIFFLIKGFHQLLCRLLFKSVCCGKSIEPWVPPIQ